MRALGRIALFWAACAVVAGGVETRDLLQRYDFGVNETTSLPNWAFIVDRDNQRPRLGQKAFFLAPPNRFYPPGARFVKIVWGLPGETVTRVGRAYYVDGRYVGISKPFSQDGQPTVPGPTGVIPRGHYYVGTPSKDSFDSRYAQIGWIGQERVIGVARPVL